MPSSTRAAYGAAMKCANLDARQEYCGPAMVFGYRAIIRLSGRGDPASLVLPKSQLSARRFAAFDFDAGDDLVIKRTALGDIINLKRFRKTKARSEADREAATNRALFGRTRAERERDEREQKKLHDVVDQHRIEDENRR